MCRSSPFASATLGLVLLLAARLAAAAPAPPTAEELAAHVAALTTPEMEGRGSGTEGGERAARYLESALAALGLRQGGEGGTWRQSFVVRRGVRVAPDALLARVGAAPLAVGQDWMPHGGALPGSVEAEVVFAGRGARYAGHGRERQDRAAPRRRPVAPREAHRGAPGWRRRRAHPGRRVAHAGGYRRARGDSLRHAHAGRGGRPARAERLEPCHAAPGRGGAVGWRGRRRRAARHRRSRAPGRTASSRRTGAPTT